MWRMFAAKIVRYSVFGARYSPTACFHIAAMNYVLSID
jgi:hypothetical protein